MSASGSLDEERDEDEWLRMTADVAVRTSSGGVTTSVASGVRWSGVSSPSPSHAGSASPYGGTSGTAASLLSGGSGSGSGGSALSSAAIGGVRRTLHERRPSSLKPLASTPKSGSTPKAGDSTPRTAPTGAAVGGVTSGAGSASVGTPSLLASPASAATPGKGALSAIMPVLQRQQLLREACQRAMPPEAFEAAYAFYHRLVSDEEDTIANPSEALRAIIGDQIDTHTLAQLQQLVFLERMSSVQNSRARAAPGLASGAAARRPH